MKDDPKFPRIKVERRQPEYVDISIPEWGSTPLKELAERINDLLAKYPEGGITQYESYGSTYQHVVTMELETDEEYQTRLGKEYAGIEHNRKRDEAEFERLSKLLGKDK